ncbi:hypothetical protein [Flavobacterium sp. J27]|uniref:hypothetical protein n=1 Tax=Flavobacterium sp. J27 TaxID=2060419 RepID=UPI0010316922|nr:hypothetical protein [Flavobacterium sp. J27]
MKYFYLYIVIILISSCNKKGYNHTENKKLIDSIVLSEKKVNDNNDMKQIYYELDCSALMCNFQIKINDVEVFSLNVDGQATMDIPINQGILGSGIQEIEIRVTPLEGMKELNNEAYVRYRVNEFDVSSGDFKFIKQFENFQTLPVQKDIPFLVHKSKFEANVDYKIDAWQNGQNLKEANFDDLKKKLMFAYNEMVNEINKGDYEKFIKRIATRENNFATMMYLNEQERNNRVKKLLYNFSNGFKAVAIDDTVIVEFSGYGKLASLKRMNGMSALYLVNAETEEELVLPITFYMPKGKTEFGVI